MNKYRNSFLAGILLTISVVLFTGAAVDQWGTPSTLNQSPIVGVDTLDTDGMTALTTGIITPSDSADLQFVSRAIYVGGAGDLTVVMKDTSVAKYTAVPQGTLLPVRATRIKATGTTATLLVPCQ